MCTSSLVAPFSECCVIRIAAYLPETGGPLALDLLALLLLAGGEVAVRPRPHLQVDDARLREVARQVLQHDVPLGRSAMQEKRVIV